MAVERPHNQAQFRTDAALSNKFSEMRRVRRCYQLFVKIRSGQTSGRLHQDSRRQIRNSALVFDYFHATIFLRTAAVEYRIFRTENLLSQLHERVFHWSYREHLVFSRLSRPYRAGKFAKWYKRTFITSKSANCLHYIPLREKTIKGTFEKACGLWRLLKGFPTKSLNRIPYRVGRMWAGIIM